MEYKDIIYSVEDGLAVITLNRPKTLNAFTPDLIDEWADSITLSQEDPKVRVVMVTGAGRGFCSGMDLKEAMGKEENKPVYQQRNWLRTWVHKVPRAIEHLDKPYIAAVNGPAAGAGMDMASMADIRIISANAIVGMNYIRVGLLPGDAGCYFLPRIIGIAKALDLIWTGRMINAEEALRIGWASEILPDAEFLNGAKIYCRRFMGAAVATQYAKRLVWRGIDQFRNINLEMAEMAMIINSSSPDTKEGSQAWIEKRKPNWRGE